MCKCDENKADEAPRCLPPHPQKVAKTQASGGKGKQWVPTVIQETQRWADSVMVLVPYGALSLTNYCLEGAMKWSGGVIRHYLTPRSRILAPSGVGGTDLHTNLSLVRPAPADACATHPWVDPQQRPPRAGPPEVPKATLQRPSCTTTTRIADVARTQPLNAGNHREKPASRALNPTLSPGSAPRTPEHTDVSRVCRERPAFGKT